jgi:putative FmdB family regulatory protein
VPFYDYKCKECGEVEEHFLTMSEHAEDPPTECKECGGEVYIKHDPKSPMKFKVGNGAYYPNRLQ